LKPEYQYVGITKNHRQFTTFTETELLHCTKTETFTICPEFQPIQHESKEQPCEISLFKNPDQLPQNCESGVNQGLIKLNQECRAYAEHVIGTGNISIKEIKMENARNEKFYEPELILSLKNLQFLAKHRLNIL
ncbi:Envelope fusion protein, partial [Aphis craccivora]